MTAAGTEYMFSTYAPDLKDLMSFTQPEINFVGTCTNLGIYLGFYMGIIYDYTNARIISFAGGILLFAGWFGAYLVTIGTINANDYNYIVMGFFMFLAGNGANSLYTGALANNVKKFHPKYRGTVVGCLVSMFGLSSAIFSPIYVYAFDSNVQEFFKFFSIATPLIAFTGIIFLGTPKEMKIEEIKDEEKEEIISKDEKENNKKVIIKEELNSIKIFTRIDFYLIFFVFMLGAGVGLTIINNLGSLVESLGGDSASRLVTFLSIFNCLGRIFAGFISDICLKFRFLSRISVLGFFLIFMSASQIYFILITYLNSVAALYPGVALIGLTYGALMSLSPSITAELFGQQFFGGNWSIIRIAPAFSSFLMSTVIAGVIYDRNTPENENNCFGWKCYGYSLIIDFFICLLAIFLCFVLSYRWLKFKKSLLQNDKGLLEGENQNE